MTEADQHQQNHLSSDLATPDDSTPTESSNPGRMRHTDDTGPARTRRSWRREPYRTDATAHRRRSSVTDPLPTNTLDGLDEDFFRAAAQPHTTQPPAAQPHTTPAARSTWPHLNTGLRGLLRRVIPRTAGTPAPAPNHPENASAAPAPAPNHPGNTGNSSATVPLPITMASNGILLLLAEQPGGTPQLLPVFSEQAVRHLIDARTRVLPPGASPASHPFAATFGAPHDPLAYRSYEQSIAWLASTLGTPVRYLPHPNEPRAAHGLYQANPDGTRVPVFIADLLEYFWLPDLRQNAFSGEALDHVNRSLQEILRGANEARIHFDDESSMQILTHFSHRITEEIAREGETIGIPARGTRLD
ncbi:hypothetical protein [Kitasatospora sp. NPDC093102]|uniref:hypothetical protein n=1 Tax=Kitasatospora sp. NPDC093102 TaxID=3155069 RepID=UPI00341B00FC